ncbi:hypothetical protein [Actinoplanes sp. NPDC051411]|uniref:hypothetical protein n=1 Tax=Actinoplanes sp. NPDC051411 TaxID=3155522 RepID=UPI003419086B
MWLLQYNPAHEQPGDYWPVRRYRDRVRVGDEVALWASGPGGGVVGLGRVKRAKGSPVRSAESAAGGVAGQAEGAVGGAAGQAEGAVGGVADGMGIEIENVRTFPAIRRELLKEDPRFAKALILRMPGGGNPFPLDHDQWLAIVDRVPAELHLVGKTVLGAAAIAAAGATAIREAVRSVTRAG